MIFQLYFYFQGKLNIQNVWKEKVFISFKNHDIP